jgi:hypothetical protein
MMYFITNGTIYWTPDNLEPWDGFYTFVASKTVMVLANGKQVALIKLAETLGKPTCLRVSTSAVMSICDVTDRDFEAQLRGRLAGIVVPGPREGAN